MRLEFRRFQRSDFAEYTAWFADPELNRRLGPMDDEWLAAVLTETASAGATWAVFDGATLAAVVETVKHPENTALAAITGLAVKPDRRGQGVGTAVLQEVLALHRREGRLEHLAYIHQDNKIARKCFGRVGFAPATPNGEGYVEFRLADRQALKLVQV